VSPDEPSLSHRASPAQIHRPSPEHTSAPIFPPPPGTRTRALSRDRPQPLFNLGVLARRAAGQDPQRVSPGATRDNRRPLQINIEPVRQPEEAREAFVRPPASRRAASAGAISTGSAAHSRSTSTTRWEPGMPLPPPPPGPPPQSQSRSQSMTRTPDPVVSPPTRRPHAISTLGPVPPTPAGWVDEDIVVRGRSPNRGLQIDTAVAVATPPPAEVNSGGNSGGHSSGHSSGPSSGPSGGSSAGGLSRAPRAVRGEPRSIRERRSESRTGKKISMEIPQSSNTTWTETVTPSDITVPPMTVLGRRPTITKSTPRSGRSFQGIDTPNSARTGGTSTPTLLAQHTESRGSTPRPNGSSRLEAPTPPFSPDNYQVPFQNDSSMIPPRSLPTPPPQGRRSITSPLSHDIGKHPPLSPRRTPGRSTTQQSSPQHQSISEFNSEAIQRHDNFAQNEAAAATDEERVRLFADFIVTESRIRRERYAAAIDAMGSEILELTRDLFRPYSKAQKEAMQIPSMNDHPSRHSSKETDHSERSGKPPSLHVDSQDGSRPGSSSSGLPSSSPSRPDSAYYSKDAFKPSLSPIAASMAASEVNDDGSSRGRPSARWWELGLSGPQSPGAKIERSKRESKYMGVPREARESLQWESNGPPSSSEPTVAGPSSQTSYTSYGPNEYPQEKIGWYDDMTSPPLGKTPTSAAFRPYSPVPPATPNPKHLDVSRLVTLPPPYPRHHPAVNNNHPDLASIRTAVRALTDYAEVEATKERFTTTDDQSRAEAASAAAQRRQNLRAKIQRDIEQGSMSYADAAKLEEESKTSEAETSKAEAKASFEEFQKAVVSPVNDLLMRRVHDATKLFSELQSQLFVDAQEQNPNGPQEEGDEQPELLEKLTLLKWIFEAREGLHREVYDLLSDRNDRYKDMVIESYRLSRNDAKVANAEKFFAADGRKRKLEYETEALTRTVEFMDVIETNVVRGVEVQLGAFWDIAPSLRQIIEKVPKNLGREFGIVIPREEYEENPEYAEFPLQYLYHLLEHGEKSTYQFIESQINLLCLLHEVKSAVAAARGRVEEAEGAEGQEAAVREGMESEERRLTDDLKEKVRCVEELWESAIGQEFDSVKERVKLFLMDEGGWEGVENQE
jgi:hypothetical protein